MHETKPSPHAFYHLTLGRGLVYDHPNTLPHAAAEYLFSKPSRAEPLTYLTLAELVSRDEPEQNRFIANFLKTYLSRFHPEPNEDSC